MTSTNALGRWLIALLCALLLPASAAFAQPAGAEHVTLDARLEHPMVQVGGQTTLALSMNPQPGWHGYWRNGGDAGLGMSIEWTLPPGVTVGDLAYPVPETLIIGGLMNHVYERPYALLAPVDVAADVPDGTRLTLTGDARWLACTDRVCVPQRGAITLTLTAGVPRAMPRDPQFDRWRAAIPPSIAERAGLSWRGDVVRIAIPLPATVALSAPHVFFDAPGFIAAGGAQRFLRNGDFVIAEVQRAPGPPSSPANVAGLLRLDDGRGIAFTAAVGNDPTRAAGRTPDQLIATVASAQDGGALTLTDAESSGTGALFATALVGAIIGGLLLNIMPCVFPILSLKALALARAGGDARTVRAEGIAYTAGAVLTCAALGLILLALRASGEALGWAFQLQRPETVLLLIVLMGLITANLAGLFEFGGLSISERWGGGNPVKSAFATGALAAFIATPCTGPFLGAALGATLTLPPWAALPVFAGLGFGLALPFLLIALFPRLRARLPRPGPWMERFRRWLALPMALTALALVWLLGRQVGSTGWLIGAAVLAAVLALGWWAGREQARGQASGLPLFLVAALIVPAAALLPAPRDAAAQSDAMLGSPWSAEAQATALASGRPLFVYFTADWCVTCKVNEAAAINRAETRAAFANHRINVLVADWTNADPQITAQLAHHRRNSVPLYLWYPAGADRPEVLPQLLTPTMLTSRAAR